MANSSSTAPKIMVFRPTMEEFKDFSKYIAYMESQGAHKAGLAKIIPPEGWCPRKKGYDDIDLMIPAPISQMVTGRQGLYQQYNVQQKALHVLEFKKMAESPTYRTPPHFDYEDLERKYWKNITFVPPIYGADVSGSLYDDNVEEFNIQHLNSILDMVKDDYEIKIEGVNTAYLYFGMWKTTFAWHTEDMDLYSINYLHFGAPKSWYVVPPEHGRRLERMAAQFFHGSSSLCSAFLRHKMTIIAPHILKNYSIPFSKITQEPGEFMITFPFAYHSGFNHGYNCAESTNFALPRWVEYGKRSSQCTCRNDCVKICMDVFVGRYQPDRYELWKIGKDYGYHPEDPTKYYAAPPPNKLELALSIRRQEEKKKSKDKVNQRRQPLSRLKKAMIKAGQYNEDLDKELVTESPKVTKKKKPRRNPVAKNTHELMEEKALDIDDESAREGMDIKCEEAEKPPELTPFWQSENDKVKQETEIKDESMLMDEETEISSSVYYQNEAEILDKFPQLKNAIDHGSLSLKLVDEKSETKEEPQDNYLEVQTKDEGSSFNFFHSQYPDIFTQNWRCEQISNGLKIKLVSPKSNQQSAISDTSMLCSIEEKSPSVISSSKSDTKESPDSEKECSPKVKRAANSKDNWAHPLVGLWQHEAFNFEVERNYNQKLASIPPHCAVCVIFTPLLDKDSFLSGSDIVPSSSVVKMPAFCYGNSLNNECIIDTNSLLSNDGTAPLLTCVNCNICVHAPCYGISTLPEGSWRCNRCSEVTENIQCCLCVLRGGALKPTTDGRWAHVICAILISETFFENTSLKGPINISNITQTRLRLKCKYCIKAHAHKDRRGVCVQCQSGRCYLPFHVTCGYMAGVIFESNDWPEPINMICTKHSGARRRPPTRQFTNVSVGESVIAKHKNRRYYWANVKHKYVQEYYSILFEDNSHSTNTLPEDIVSKDVAHDGAPEINEKVKIKWTDGMIYNGIFKGSQSIDMFVVEFDDGTIQHQERRQIFAADEDLPKEVQSKMSHSSEGKSLNISEVSGKRLRLFNQKYFSV